MTAPLALLVKEHIFHVETNDANDAYSLLETVKPNSRQLKQICFKCPS